VKISCVAHKKWCKLVGNTIKILTVSPRLPLSLFGLLLKWRVFCRKENSKTFFTEPLARDQFFLDCLSKSLTSPSFQTQKSLSFSNGQRVKPTSLILNGLFYGIPSQAIHIHFVPKTRPYKCFWITLFFPSSLGEFLFKFKRYIGLSSVKDYITTSMNPYLTPTLHLN